MHAAPRYSPSPMMRAAVHVSGLVLLLAAAAGGAAPPSIDTATVRTIDGGGRSHARHVIMRQA